MIIGGLAELNSSYLFLPLGSKGYVALSIFGIGWKLKKIQVSLSSCYKFLAKFWLKVGWKLGEGGLLTLIGRLELVKVFEG